ncbi:MAG: hypothetical protein ACLFVU_06995 [Phycisphaerae bacterium]
MPFTRSLSVTLILMCIAAAVPAGALADGLTVDMAVDLEGALHRGDPKEGRYDLHTEAFCRDGVWGFVYGTALDFNNGEHIGRVDELNRTDRKVTGKLHIRIMGDPWTKGGRSNITFSAEPTDKEGVFKGTYRCEFNNAVTEGPVTVQLNKPPAPPSGYVPVKPGERPRMLFRAHQLDDLKAKLNTPFGQAARKRLEASSDPISLGLMYQLTGEKKYAEKAWDAVEREKADFGPGAFSLGHAWGPRITKIATAYDLCYDAWDKERHAELATYFDQVTPMLYWQLRRVTRKANWHPCSNYSGPMRGAASIGSLALWGIPGEKPEEPALPATHKNIEPAESYSPPKGVPVHDYTDATMPNDWIYIGGFQPRVGEQVLDPDKLRPAVGDVTKYRDQKDTWRHISREKDKGYWQSQGMMGGKPMIDITNAIDRAYDTTSFFYTVVRNDKSRWVRLKADYSQATFYLNGKEIEEGGYAKIEKGLYPMLVKAPIGRCEPWGRHLMQPKLIEVEEKEAVAYREKRMAEHEKDLTDWRYTVKVWESRGKMNIKYLQFYHLGRRHMKRYYRQGIGTGGFQPETGSYSAISVREPMLYASMHRTMFGRPVTPQKDIELFCVRKLMPMIFLPDGKIVAQDINGTPKMPLDNVQRAWPIIPEQYKPALLWYWNRQTGASPADPSKALAGMTPFAFVRYPLDAKPKPPAEIMPLTWEAETFGFYCFRNEWDGADDFVFQAFAKAHPIGGWNHPNAGAIRLVGLGHVWATGPSSRGADRWQEPVVDLPADAVRTGATGQVTYKQLNKDGSGAVTIDLTDLYSGVKEGMKLYDRHGKRNPEARADSGITGFRAVAIDYSGKSGAPAVLAVVDKVSGAKETRWMWQLPESEACKTTLTDNGFTMDYGDATMTATFIAPAKPELELATGKRKYKIKAGGKGGQMTTRDVNAVYATGGDGEYFVVFTVQKKNPPAVKVKGSGLDARATVGNQSVRFDGKKIVIGK